MQIKPSKDFYSKLFVVVLFAGFIYSMVMFGVSITAKAQAPYDPQRDFLAECSQDRLTVKILTAQLQAVQCLKDVKAKGDELSKAVLDFKAGKTVKDSGATIQPMYQLAEDYQKAEKACVVNKLAGEPAR